MSSSSQDETAETSSREESFAAKLAERYGDVDPGITLDAAPASGGDSSSALLKRLGERGPRAPRYRLLGEIARGGMGAILSVWDQDLRRRLAMKVALGKGEPSSGATPPPDARQLARFLEEAQITGQLDHPGIVPVHELGIDSEGRVYFTMRLVKGRDLKQVFELVFAGREGWSETRAVGVIQRACEAMAYAHAKGVIHRDLKPANVMVGDFGEVYVMDWGLARVLARDDAHDLRLRPEASTSAVRTDRSLELDASPDAPVVTADGDVLGTPVYMPPEQARGDVEQLGPRSDVYALGAMLYHLLARHMPYVPSGTRATNGAILAMVSGGPPRRLHEIRPDVPAELAAICEKAMERRPETRYADTLALASDLRAYLEHRVVAAYETGAFAEARKWVERNRALAASLAAAVLLLVLGLTVSLAQKARADRNAELAEARAADVLSLSAFQHLGDLVAEARGLWPAEPEMVPRYDRWLARAQAILAGGDGTPGLEGHRRKLAELRARALPADDGSGAARAWRFEKAEDTWWHGQLEKLVREIEAFADPATGLSGAGISSEHGWGIARRRAWAASVAARTRDGSEARRRWAEASASIADVARCPMYGGLALEPQLGLLPIGRDPESGLWEFVHLQTGAEPARDADGRLVPSDEMGIVLVLIPGGTFRMGAQRDDPSQPSFDPEARDNEGPVHEVALAPYFLSKYEMTQDQWQRFAGSNSSQFGPGDPIVERNARSLPWSGLHPVEQVSWEDCTELLARLGLVLPTEAQWERAARAGTSEPWWTGSARASLQGAANLMDGYARAQNLSVAAVEDWLDDGSTLHARVGTYRANAFGLHDVHGNLWEWCRDSYGPYSLPVREGDGERLADDDPSSRVTRGGSFGAIASDARSANRELGASAVAGGDLGVRPARAVTAP